MTLRASHQEAFLTSEEAAFVRQSLTACSRLLTWITDNGGEQGQALLAAAARAAAGGNTPGHLAYDVSLAIDYLDFAPAPRKIP